MGNVQAGEENIPAQQVRQFAHRWPRLWQLCEQAGMPTQVELDDNGPETTLVVNGIHLSSCYDSMAEARLQARLIPLHSDEAWVYGVGNGDLIRHLLQRSELECLHVVPLNWSVLYASLQVFDHRDWLGDTRVELCAASSLEKLCYPFAALPACMRLADEAAARLRDWAVLDLATPFARQGFAKRSETYRQHMAENEAMLSGDGDVAELFGTADGRPIVVAAAGPTLADNYGWLRQNRSDFILIAVDAALIPLLEAGIEPDIVIAIDGSATGIPPYFATDLSRMHNHVLVYFPIVAPSVIQQWPGARACAYTDHALYADIRKRLPRADLFASGTVLHAAVDLAVQMGSTEIHLLGVDFSFPRGRTHVEGAAHTGDAPEAGTWVLNGYGERVPTLANMCAYLRDLERYLLRHPQVQFFNHSRAGAYIEGCRYIDGQAP